MLYTHQKPVSELTFPELRFRDVFEEVAEFERPYTLPFNTLVGVVEDGGKANAPVRDLRTGQVWIRRKNYLFFTPCQEPVLYTAKESMRYIALHFNLEIYPGIDVYRQERSWIVEYSPGAVKRLAAAYHTADPALCACRLREFCLWFCGRHWPRQPIVDPRRERFAGVLQFMREHATAETTVRELAAMMHLRLETFSHEFTEAFGESPKELLQNELASQAAGLLQRPDLTVKEIAYRLHFCNAFYFSKFFKRRIGSLPTEYRRRSVN